MELFLEDPPLEATIQPPLGAVAIRAARAKLNTPPRIAPVWPMVAAAAFAAFTALLLATAIIVGLPRF